MSELATMPITLTNGITVNEFYFCNTLKWNDNAAKKIYESANNFDMNNFQKIKQIVGISWKLKTVQDSSGKIKSEFLKKRKDLMEKVYGELAIFILKTMNSIIYIKEPVIFGGASGSAAELSEIGLDRALVFALDIAENMFPLYKEIINIHYPSGVSQDITKLERDEFIADKRKEFGIIKSKKDKQ